MAQVEGRKKSVSEKTQKLRGTTSMISNTLNSLKTPRAVPKSMLAEGTTGSIFAPETNTTRDTVRVQANNVDITETKDLTTKESKNFIGLTSLNANESTIKEEAVINNSKNYSKQRENNTINVGYSDNLNLYDTINQLQYALSESKLETKSKSLEYDALVSNYEHLKAEKHDSHVKSSRKGLEITSLIQQNEIYRDENRKLVESEAKLRAKVLELNIPKNNTLFSLDVQDQALYEQVLQKLETQIISTNQKTNTLKSSIQVKKTSNPLELVKEMLELLLLAAKKSKQPIKAKTTLSLINDLSENLELISSQTQSLMKGSYELDNRIQNLGLQSSNLTLEATDTIEKLKKLNKYNKMEWDGKEKKIMKQISEIKDRYKDLLKENEELIMIQKEIISENEELAQLAGRPDPDPEVVLLNGHSDQVIVRYQDMHKEDVRKLQGHIEILTKTIDEWKEENKLLNSSLKDSKLVVDSLEKEKIKSAKLVSETQNRYEDEKLKNQKAVELIKSLKEHGQKPKAYSSEIQNLEQLVKDTIRTKESTVPETNTVNSHLNNLMSAGDQSAEMNVLKHLKVIDVKTKQIKALEQKLNDKVLEFQSLFADNEKVKQKISQQKDKFHVRELAWLDKLKELKEANVLNTKELEELNHCLESYAEQYSSIQSLLNQEGQLDCSHPLPFSTIFHSLYNQFKNIAEQCQKLEKEISDTTHSLTIRTKESQEHLKNSEKLELNLKEKIKKLDTMSNDKLRMETERKELEQQLTEAQRARKDANETLKVVISRTAQYLTTEN